MADQKQIHWQDLRRSTQVTRAGYDAETRTLYVQFSRGVVYSYNDVPPYLYVKLIGSQQAGIVFRDEIKDKFTYQKLK